MCVYALSLSGDLWKRTAAVPFKKRNSITPCLFVLIVDVACKTASHDFKTDNMSCDWS